MSENISIDTSKEQQMRIAMDQNLQIYIIPSTVQELSATPHLNKYLNESIHQRKIVAETYFKVSGNPELQIQLAAQFDLLTNLIRKTIGL